MPGSLTALFSKTSNQNVTPLGSYVPVIWETQNWGLAGLWDPLVDPTKIVTPAGINWIRFTFNAIFSDAVNQVIMAIHKNGASTLGGAMTQFSSPGTEVSNISTGWLPTTVTDYWTAVVVSASVRTLNFGDNTSLSVEVTS